MVPIILLSIFALLILFILYLIMGHNNRLKRVEYTFESEKINNEITILHIGDIHGTQYGENNEELLEMIEEEDPDILLLTGDMLDEEVDIHSDFRFLKRLSERWNVYAVTGNHEEEAEDESFEELKSIYYNFGVNLLCDDNAVIEINGTRLNICGVDIPRGNGDPYPEAIDASLEGIDTNDYTIMLFHRPDPVNLFIGRGIDLMLSGHTHGGHWIVPGLINGVYAPEQGIFPKYAGGLYSFKNDLSLVVTRGLSLRSTFIPRAFNPPELVVIKLK